MSSIQVPKKVDIKRGDIPPESSALVPFDAHANAHARYHGKRLFYPKRSNYANTQDFNKDWAAFVKQLPDRQSIIDPNAFKAVQAKIDKNEPLLFQPIWVNDHMHKWKYNILMTGIVRGGAKAIVLVDGIEPTFDVRAPPGIDGTVFMGLLQGWLAKAGLANNYGPNMKVIKMLPPKEFSEREIPYVRISNENTKRRGNQIKYIHNNLFVYHNDKTNTTCEVSLDTANDDASCYYRVVARERKLKLAGWLMLQNYTEMPDLGKSPVPVVLRVDIRDILEPDSPTLKTKAIKVADHRDLVRDPSIMMTWDLETYAIKHTGDAPQVERVLTLDGKYDDIIFMQSALYNWYHEDDVLVRVNFTDLPVPVIDDALVIQVTDQADIIQMKAVLMERMKPDYVSGFNDSSYDWPFVFRRAEVLDQQFGFKLMKELRERTCVLRVTDEVAKYTIKGVNNDIDVKIDAETKTRVVFLDVPGYICLDTRVIFRQLYPNAEVSSLNSFLEANKLGKKEDMPYQTMFKIYRLMRQLAHDLKTSVYEDIMAGLELWQEKHGPEYKPFACIDLLDNPFGRIDASDYNIDTLTVAEVIALAKQAENVVRYCNVDAQRCQELLRKRNVIADKREMANLSFTSTFDALYRAGGMKVRNIVMGEAVEPGWNIAFSNVTRDKTKSTKKYPGAYVIPPKKGLYRDHRYMKAARLLQLNRPDIYQALFGEKIDKARAANEPNPDRPRDAWVNPQSSEFVKEIHDVTVAYQAKLFHAMRNMPGRRVDKMDVVEEKSSATNVKTSSSRPLPPNARTNPKEPKKAKTRVEELDELAAERPIRIRLPKPTPVLDPSHPDSKNVALREALSQVMQEIMNGPDFTVNQVEEIERNNDIFPMTDRPNSGLDHSSLYPNIIITFNLSPEKCITDPKVVELLKTKKDKYGNPYRFREAVFHYRHKDDPKGPENEVRAWFVQYTPVEVKDPATGKSSFARFDGMGIYPHILKKLFDMRVGLKGGLAKYNLPLEFFNTVVNDRSKDKLPAIETYEHAEQRKIVLETAEKDLAKRKAEYESKKKAILKEKIEQMEKIIKYIQTEWDVIAKENNAFQDGINKLPFNKFHDETAFGYNYYNAKQLAIKVLMNTFYGETGFNISPFFLVQVAGAITYWGQKMLKLPKAFIEDIGFNVIYGDTDSLYTSPPEDAYAEVDALFESGKISKDEWWYRMADLSMDVMDQCRDKVNKMLYEYTGTKFLSMAYEEVLWPYMMVGKKKYVGLKHENIVNLAITNKDCKFDEFAKSKILFVRGLELKKRGSSEVLKKCCLEVLYSAFNIAEHRTLREICEDKLNEVKNRQWDPRMFIKTVKYKLPGKKPDGTERQGNVKVKEFQKRMKEVQDKRPDIGIREAELGERFKYIIVERYPHTHNIRGVTQGLGMGERMEYADVVADPQTGKSNLEYEKYLGESLKPDLDYYVTNELIGQLSRFIIYHPDYDKVYEYVRDIPDDADLDKIYKEADNKAHNMAKNQLTKFYETHYATKYRSYTGVVQTMYRKTVKRIEDVWETKYGDGSRVMKLATKMITSSNDDMRNIHSRFNIADALLSDLKLLADRDAEQPALYDVRQAAEKWKFSPQRLQVIYRPILNEREAKARKQATESLIQLSKHLPEVQDFAFRQMNWLSNSMKGLLNEIKIDRAPIAVKPEKIKAAKAEAVVADPAVRAELLGDGKKKRKSAKKKEVTEVTLTEVTKQKAIQVKVELPDQVIDDTVSMSLDMDGLDDQETARDTLDIIQENYEKLVSAKFTLREITYMRKTMEDIVRSASKLPSRGADPRVLAELRKRDSPMMQDFASFLASTDTYIPGPNGMSY